MDRSSVLRDDRRRARGRSARRLRDRLPRTRVTTTGTPQSNHTQPAGKPPTHAGGVVVRRDGAALRYLVVSSNTESRSWVLPKGRIEPGESPSQTAHREVLEEAGVDASVRVLLDTIEFVGRKGPVRADFFLM